LMTMARTWECAAADFITRRVYTPVDRIWRMKWHVRCVAIKVWTCMHVASLLISRLQACSVWPNIGEESPTWGMHPHFDIDRN
jgi:hypothetical protein